MGFLKRLWRKLFRKAKHLDYDATDRVGDDEANGYGGKGGLSKSAELARRKILQTKLVEGDTYRLGPEAIVTVGPEGLAGKAWITARIKANEEKRRQKFLAKWETQRKRAIDLMMMTEAELKESGVWAEVQQFVSENYEAARRLGLNVTGITVPKDAKELAQQQTFTKFFELAKTVSGEVSLTAEEQRAKELQNTLQWHALNDFAASNNLSLDTAEQVEAALKQFREQGQHVAMAEKA